MFCCCSSTLLFKWNYLSEFFLHFFFLPSRLLLSEFKKYFIRSQTKTVSLGSVKPAHMGRFDTFWSIADESDTINQLSLAGCEQWDGSGVVAGKDVKAAVIFVDKFARVAVGWNAAFIHMLHWKWMCPAASPPTPRQIWVLGLKNTFILEFSVVSYQLAVVSKGT